MNTRQEMADMTGLTLDDFRAIEQLAEDVAREALASGATLEQALQLASDAGIAKTNQLMKARA